MIIALRYAKREFLGEKFRLNILCISGTHEEMFDYGYKDILKSCGFEWNENLRAWETLDKSKIRALSEMNNFPSRVFLNNLLREVDFSNYKILRMKDEIYFIGNNIRFSDDLEKLGFKWSKYPLPNFSIKTEDLTIEKIRNCTLPIQTREKLLLSLRNEDVEIRIKGSKIYLRGAHFSIEKKIADEMKIVIEKTKFTEGYEENLYNFEEHWAPIGYLDKVIQIMNENFINYEIEDLRAEPRNIELEWHGHELYDFQKELVEKAYDQGNAFLVAPTGSGKTVMALRLIYQYSMHSIILVHRKDLLYQWQKRISEALQIDKDEIGLIGDDNYIEKNITVCMVQTAIDKQPRFNYGLMIVDEAHHMPSDTFYDLAKHLDCKYRFGLSATPYRSDNKEKKLYSMTGSILQTVTARELIEMGYLAEPILEVIDGWNGQLPINERGKDLTWQEELTIACNDEETNLRIVRRAIDLFDEGHYVYIDVRRVKHGNTLKRMISEEGRESIFLQGKDGREKREMALNNFKNRNFILISTLIKEGVDLPEMTTIILAGPAESKIENIQKVGRVLRKKDDLNKAYIIDRYDKGRATKKWFRKRQKTFKNHYNI